MYTNWYTQLQLIEEVARNWQRGAERRDALRELRAARRADRRLSRRLTAVALAVLGMR